MICLIILHAVPIDHLESMQTTKYVCLEILQITGHGWQEIAAYHKAQARDDLGVMWVGEMSVCLKLECRRLLS